jgi:hypothetical protein
MACVLLHLEERLSLFVAPAGFPRAAKDLHFSLALLPAPRFGRSGRALLSRDAAPLFVLGSRPKRRRHPSVSDHRLGERNRLRLAGGLTSNRRGVPEAAALDVSYAPSLAFLGPFDLRPVLAVERNCPDEAVGGPLDRKDALPGIAGHGAILQAMRGQRADSPRRAT